MIMPFGKYRGLDLADLPNEYLEWLRTRDLREPLQSAVEDEIRMRKMPAGPTRKAAEEIVSTGYRALALKFHPDRGGDTAQMQAVNAAAGWLRGQLRGLSQ
jgi:hypothetical protein